MSQTNTQEYVEDSNFFFALGYLKGCHVREQTHLHYLFVSLLVPFLVGTATTRGSVIRILFTILSFMIKLFNKC